MITSKQEFSNTSSLMFFFLFVYFQNRIFTMWLRCFPSQLPMEKPIETSLRLASMKNSMDGSNTSWWKKDIVTPSMWLLVIRNLLFLLCLQLFLSNCKDRNIFYCNWTNSTIKVFWISSRRVFYTCKKVMHAYVTFLKIPIRCKDLLIEAFFFNLRVFFSNME